MYWNVISYSLFTQNARSRLRFHDDMKQESLWVFSGLALVSFGALVAMKTSEVVMVVTALKASGVEVVVIVMKDRGSWWRRYTLLKVFRIAAVPIPFGLSILTLGLCSNTMP